MFVREDQVLHRKSALIVECLELVLYVGNKDRKLFGFDLGVGMLI